MGRFFIKLCFFTNHFYPEDFKVNDIAFELSNKGYDITVITAIPDYPQGKFYEGYSLFKRRNEIVNGVKVHRLPIIPRSKGKKIQLVFNYLSYFISTLLFTILYLYKEKYDIVFVHLTSPFFIGLPAVLLKRKQNIPLVFWVLDLWPESLSAASGIKNKLVLDTQIRLVRYVYNNCNKILIGSKGFKKSICEKGRYADRIEYFPNWAEDVFPLKYEYDYLQNNPFAQFSDSDFVILFTGNIGEAQNLECVIDAAFELREIKNIRFVFMGDGRHREKLITKMNNMALSSSVFFPGRYPIESMSVFMQRADVLLVSLKNELIFSLTVPSKLQFYMAQGKPILAILNGDGAKIVNEACCGVAVSDSDNNILQNVIRQMYKMPKNELIEMGKNGKKYYDKYFKKEQRIEQLNNIFISYDCK